MIRDNFKGMVDSLKKESTYYATRWEEINFSRISVPHINRCYTAKSPCNDLTFTDFVIK